MIEIICKLTYMVAFNIYIFPFLSDDYESISHFFPLLLFIFQFIILLFCPIIISDDY